MPKRGKKYVEAAAQYDKANLYEVKEAMELAVATSKAKFDETIEVHIRLGVDMLTSRLEVLSYCHTVLVRLRRFWYSLRDLRQQKLKQLVLIM